MWLVQELCITPFRGGGEPTAGHISRRKRFEDLSFLSFRIQASVLPFDLLRMLLSRQTSQGNNRKVKGRFDQEGKAKILYYDCLTPYLINKRRAAQWEISTKRNFQILYENEDGILFKLDHSMQK